MTRIGIITGHPTKPKRRFFGGYTKEAILSEKNPFSLTVVYVPFGEDELRELTGRKAEKILTKAKKLLSEPVDHIVLSDGFDNFFQNEQQWLKSAARLEFLSAAPGCIRRISAECGMNLMDAKVCIRDSESDRISETLMKKLCFDTKSMVLCTKDRERGKVICEKFLDETGMVVPVVRGFQDSRADVVIDADRGEIRFGKSVRIDGILLDFELGGANVDSLRVAACLGDFDITGRILSYLSGKKKLTL